jgi:predicted Zn-dependent peptidase
MVKVQKSQIIKNYEKGPIRRSLFANGAVSLFHQFPGMSSAVVKLYFLAGSVFEKENEYGLSHVIEHMLFKEKATNHLLKDLELSGAQINAYTYKEYVCFEMECVAHKLEDFLPKFLQLFFDPYFDEQNLMIEKQIIIQEIKEDHDDTESFAIDYLFERHFPTSFGHSIAGTIGHVKQFTIKDLMRYYRQYFTAQRMVLSVVSGLDHPKLSMIFADCMPKRMHKASAPIRLKTNSCLGKMNHFKSNLKKKLEHTTVFYALDGLSISHDDYYSLLILDELLFEGLTSKFFKCLREELGVIYGLGSSINSFAKTGNYVMVFNTQKKYLPKLHRQVNLMLEYYQNNPFTDEEIASTKLRFMDAIDMGFDNMHDRCEFIALEELYASEKFSIAHIKQKLDKVNAQTIMRILKTMAKRGVTRLVLGP